VFSSRAQHVLGPDILVLVYTANVLRQTLTSLISYVLEHMIGHIPMQTILEKLVSDRGDSRFGDFRSIFVRMLDNYAYEQNILETSNQLLRYDTWRAFSADVAQRKRAFRSIKDAPDVKVRTLVYGEATAFSPLFVIDRWKVTRTNCIGSVWTTTRRLRRNLGYAVIFCLSFPR
jgi:hypothetical protein